MNESTRTAAILRYLDEVTEQFYSGHAIEHAYRPALKALMSVFDDTIAVNDPKHSEHGAPDFVFLKKSNQKIIQGYAEAKDITVSLDKTEKSEQMKRYAGYANLFLTDYLEFRFFRNGDKYQTISLGHIENGTLYKTPENGERLMRELEAFLEQTPEKIRNGKRLAQIMGGKARRIRDNVAAYLHGDDKKSTELLKIFEMMKKMLVHDLTPDKFADMYAQTLVYGLFVARYGDSTPESFSRIEARDLVPASNPFLRHFFDHIVGPDFDTRLGYIVDELCEIFSVSDVQEIVHKHLKIAEDTTEAKDPIIHFYEDFLQEYDPDERKAMGAYYTPIPVVQFIVRQVDALLKEEFGIVKGLASDETFTKKVDIGQEVSIVKAGNVKATKTTVIDKKFHTVQVLDPAVGTATFLNETIKHIHKSFAGQEGRWQSYVNNNLLNRLHGFELMMAPYTIAHLKLGMTLKETGVTKLDDRLGVYLTNTLEEGIPIQQDIFSFGLAEAVSEESRLAAEVKSERPVMVVMGNPPYSVSSNNKSKFIEVLMQDYKVGVTTTRNTQPLSDDYLKFIKFAQHMVEKNSHGIVAYICNRSFIEGIVHHKVRESLLYSFDKIFVYDLNGDATRNQAAGDSTDQNIFDIKQGTCIIILVKKDSKDGMGQVFFSDIRGSRKHKFETLLAGNIPVKELSMTTRYNFFVDKDLKDTTNDLNIGLGELFNVHNSAIATSDDVALVSRQPTDLHTIPFYYRPFDKRYINYDLKLVKGNRYNGLVKYLMSYKNKEVFDNLILTCSKNITTPSFTSVLMSDGLTERKYSDYSRGPHLFPLYLYYEDGTRAPNFNPAELSALTRNITIDYTPEDIIDYIYGILHSPSYRKKYDAFLKIDFPRIPIPHSDDEFTRIAALGNELRQLHLMKSPALDTYETTYSEPGDNLVEKLTYKEGDVYINDTQYFGNVPQEAWEFYIGGYQPAQKWLKDRKGDTLSDEELDHYQRIIKTLTETIRIMAEIG